jgi:hypothetical protein
VSFLSLSAAGGATGVAPPNQYRTHRNLLFPVHLRIYLSSIYTMRSIY